MFSCSLLASSATSLRTLTNTNEGKQKAETGRRGEGNGNTRGENFSVCWSSEKTVSSRKQMRAGRAGEGHLGMVRKSGKDKETCAGEWK